jgi:hypothetical protein
MTKNYFFSFEFIKSLMSIFMQNFDFYLHEKYNKMRDVLLANEKLLLFLILTYR